MEEEQVRGFISMIKIKELLRLTIDKKISVNKASVSLGIARAAAQKYVKKAKVLNITPGYLANIDDFELEKVLCPQVSKPEKFNIPDWEYINKELRKPNVNLMLLWCEYKENEAEGISYSQFCNSYRKYKKQLNLSMRQEHIAGEKVFVDYAGSSISIKNTDTNEIKQAYLFVATLGASNYMYAEATWSMDTISWINAHVNLFNFLGGIPKIIVPDNTKAAINKSNYYDPETNVTYHKMAIHYGVAILPARPRKPKDKAKVEKSVQICQTWILAALRNRTFFSLGELNQSITELLKIANNKPFKKIQGSRLSWFETIDKPALDPLPQIPFEEALWQKCRVQSDYHLNIDDHYYSVPYELVGKEVEIRDTQKTIECFYKGKRIASHVKSLEKNKKTTIDIHMPKAHRAISGMNRNELFMKAKVIGSQTVELFNKIIESKEHESQAFRTLAGILRLAKNYGEDRLEAACERALLINSYSYTSINSILKTGLDKQKNPEVLQVAAIEHENIRGSNYFN